MNEAFDREFFNAGCRGGERRIGQAEAIRDGSGYFFDRARPVAKLEDEGACGVEIMNSVQRGIVDHIAVGHWVDLQPRGSLGGEVLEIVHGGRV